MEKARQQKTVSKFLADILILTEGFGDADFYIYVWKIMEGRRKRQVKFRGQDNELQLDLLDAYKTANFNGKR